VGRVLAGSGLVIAGGWKLTVSHDAFAISMAHAHLVLVESAGVLATGVAVFEILLGVLALRERSLAHVAPVLSLVGFAFLTLHVSLGASWDCQCLPWRALNPYGSVAHGGLMVFVGLVGSTSRRRVNAPLVAKIVMSAACLAVIVGLMAALIHNKATSAQVIPVTKSTVRMTEPRVFEVSIHSIAGTQARVEKVVPNCQCLELDGSPSANGGVAITPVHLKVRIRRGSADAGLYVVATTADLRNRSVEFVRLVRCPGRAVECR
jgi:hypothetical protein